MQVLIIHTQVLVEARIAYSVDIVNYVSLYRYALETVRLVVNVAFAFRSIPINLAPQGFYATSIKSKWC